MEHERSSLLVRLSVSPVVCSTNKVNPIEMEVLHKIISKYLQLCNNMFKLMEQFLIILHLPYATLHSHNQSVGIQTVRLEQERCKCGDFLSKRPLL